MYNDFVGDFNLPPLPPPPPPRPLGTALLNSKQAKSVTKRTINLIEKRIFVLILLCPY